MTDDTDYQPAGTAATLNDVAQSFLALRAATLTSGREVRRVVERDLLPWLGARPIATIGRAEIMQLIESRARTAPRAAALLLGYIKQIWLHAEDRELLAVNRVSSLRSARIHPALRPRPRQRMLSDAELRRFWSHAGDGGMHTLTVLALRLILVTGQRPGEVAGMRWSELAGATWIIPPARRGKTRTRHVVPLPELAQALLAAARADAARAGRNRHRPAHEHVFTIRNGQPLTVSALGRAVHRQGTRLHLEHPPWTPHDLRRTCRTHLAACGIADEIAERVIGHAPRGIVATYNLHRYQAEIRAALEAWCERLLGIVTGD